jgi:hypothetical protein
MNFKLEKTTIAELTESELDKVAGGTNSYWTCAGTCGCPPNCDQSVNCPTTSGDCGAGTSTKCVC